MAQDKQTNTWEFKFHLNPNREIQGRINSEIPHQEFAGAWLDQICDFIQWLKVNEVSVRAHIAEQMFELWLRAWRDEEIDYVRTPLGFQRKLKLYAINFYEKDVDLKNYRLGAYRLTSELFYEDGGMFGGHSVILSMETNGQFTSSPKLFG